MLQQKGWFFGSSSDFPLRAKGRSSRKLQRIAYNYPPCSEPQKSNEGKTAKLRAWIQGETESQVGLGELANRRDKHLFATEQTFPKDVSERQTRFRRTGSIVLNGFGISKSRPFHPPRGVRAQPLNHNEVVKPLNHNEVVRGHVRRGDGRARKTLSAVQVIFNLER